MTGKQDICLCLPCDKIGANGKTGMAMYVIVPNCEKMRPMAEYFIHSCSETTLLQNISM